ncbi:MAG: UDP-N-acetylmuramoyl-tripeptide--D-alanyl-D-alanine ligase [Phycisphaeraceae bacterium]
MPTKSMTHSFWTASGLAEATGGAWQGAPPADTDAIGVSIDSRTIQPGELFIALRGERFDGHKFVADALNKGAIGAMIERSATDELAGKAPLLIVDDTLAALQRLAGQWRTVLRESGCTVITVAGSNGKTTTRHLIHTILNGAPVAVNELQPHRTFTGTQSPRSFNNHIGVPLTLLGALATHDYVAVEIGTNHPGEVAELGALVQPDIAVIVSIGREHLEMFGSVEAVAQEELSLLRCLPPGGRALIPADDWLQPLLPETEGITVQHIQPLPTLTRHLSLPGEHAAHNAAAAAQVARWLGVSDDHVAAALARVEPVPGRFQVRTVGELTLIHDAYNANPESVRAALSTMAGQWPEAKRRVFVFGDMMELGDAAAEAHREVGRWAGQMEDGPVLLVAIGALATFAAAEANRVQPAMQVYAWPAWDDALPQRVAELLEPGDVVLLKGSRGMALERLIPAIEKKFVVSGF